VEQRCGHVQQHQRKEGEGQIIMRVPEQRMHTVALRQDRRRNFLPYSTTGYSAADSIAHPSNGMAIMSPYSA